MLSVFEIIQEGRHKAFSNLAAKEYGMFISACFLEV
jgi:hypothetical protein